MGFITNRCLLWCELGWVDFWQCVVLGSATAEVFFDEERLSHPRAIHLARLDVFIVIPDLSADGRHSAWNRMETCGREAHLRPHAIATDASQIEYGVEGLPSTDRLLQAAFHGLDLCLLLSRRGRLGDAWDRPS